MVTEVFVLCDGANDSNGKLNILGAFDTFLASEFPFTHPHCTVAVRLRFDHDDTRESRIGLTIQSVNGKPPLAKVDTTLKHGSSLTPTSTANLIVNINSLRFETPGDYSIILKVNDMPAAVTPLYVHSSAASSTH